MVLAIQSVWLTNELADPGLEKTVADRLAAWTPYGRGYALDATEVQSGRLAVRCETRGDQDGMGIAQVIHGATGPINGRSLSADGAKRRTLGAAETTACI